MTDSVEPMPDAPRPEGPAERDRSRTPLPSFLAFCGLLLLALIGLRALVSRHLGGLIGDVVWGPIVEELRRTELPPAELQPLLGRVRELREQRRRDELKETELYEIAQSLRARSVLPLIRLVALQHVKLGGRPEALRGKTGDDARAYDRALRRVAWLLERGRLGRRSIKPIYETTREYGERGGMKPLPPDELSRLIKALQELADGAGAPAEAPPVSLLGHLEGAIAAGLQTARGGGSEAKGRGGTEPGSKPKSDGRVEESAGATRKP